MFEDRTTKDRHNLYGAVNDDLIGTEKSQDITWDIMETNTLKSIKKILEKGKVFFKISINLE